MTDQTGGHSFIPDSTPHDNLANHVQEAAQTPTEQFLALYRRQLEARDDYDAEEVNEKIGEMAVSEQKFIAQVCSAVESLAASANSQNPVILFDIDETIAKVRFLDGENYEDIIRPSLPVLVQALAEKVGARFGFITTRSHKGIEKSLGALSQAGIPTVLFPSDYHFSTRDISQEEKDMMDMDFSGDEEPKIKVLRECKDFMTPDVFKDPPFLFPGAKEKLLLVRNALVQHPHDSFIIVDDFSYPEYLSSPRVKGVHLDSDSQFRYD